MPGTMIEAFRAGKMSSRPDYYSGRGPNPGDCGASHLKGVWDYLAANVGKEAAEAMAATVARQPDGDMGATEIMHALLDLERSGYAVSESATYSSADGIAMAAKQEDGSYAATGAAMGGLFSAMFDRRSDEQRSWEGSSIKHEFLRSIRRTDLLPEGAAPCYYRPWG